MSMVFTNLQNTEATDVAHQCSSFRMIGSKTAALNTADEEGEDYFHVGLANQTGLKRCCSKNGKAKVDGAASWGHGNSEQIPVISEHGPFFPGIRPENSRIAGESSSKNFPGP